MTDPKPRAVAVLVALRRCSLTTAQIRNAISDDTLEQTRDLLADMTDDDRVTQLAARWYVDLEGVAWLERNGLTVARGARTIRAGGA
jgi:hypothetical protein